jgi:hypothetical protein
MSTKASTGDLPGMDAKGALHLRRAIEQQEHWTQAPAVREGRQAVRDPDIANLVELGDALRRYRGADGQEYTKRLVNGRWSYLF